MRLRYTANNILYSRSGQIQTFSGPLLLKWSPFNEMSSLTVHKIDNGLYKRKKRLYSPELEFSFPPVFSGEKRRRELFEHGTLIKRVGSLFVGNPIID